MKVNIGPYISRATSIRFERFCKDKIFGEEWYWSVDGKFSEDWKYKLIDNIGDVIQWIQNHTVNYYYDNKKRRVKVHIDNYDVWGLDHTLALIALPALRLLKVKKHGIPMIDLADVPEELHAKAKETHEHNYPGDSDSEEPGSYYSEETWEWILDEMIWAMERIALDDDDYLYNKDITVEERIRLMKEREARILRGTILFGKYFRALWD